MSTTTISDEEFEREIRTLKNLRRRSGSSPGPGELPLDPDLPPADAFQAGHSHPDTYSSNDDVTLTAPDGDEGGLFWVPAHLHPELAPGEFRAFLKEHTMVNPTAVKAGEAGEASLGRSPSWLARSRSLSGGLGRQKSMLSRQYTPRHGDKIEEEQVPSLSRQRSARYGSGRNGDLSPTLQDLQKLEELVENAEIGDDPAKMRQMLRRSLTLNTVGVLEDKAPGADDDEANSPIVIPRPGSIIRRTARTKIRKGPPGEGGGFGNRRYSSSRRHPHIGSQGGSPIDDDASPRPSEEGRWNDTRHSEETHSTERASDETSEERSSESPHTSAESTSKSTDPNLADMSFGSDDSNDEAMIFDAYAHEHTPSATSSASDYEGPSRSPSPADPNADRPPLAPITAPKAQEGAWYEDDNLTPTQDSPMSAALHAMTLLPSSGPSSDDIFHTPTTPQQQQGGRQPIVRRDPSHPQQLQQPQRVSPTSPEGPTPPRIDTRPNVLPQSGPVTQSPTEMFTGGLPPGALPIRQSSAPPAPAKPEQPDIRNNTTPAPAARPALVVERTPLNRVEPAASAVTPTLSGKEKVKDKESKKHSLFGKKDKKDKEKGKKEKDRFLGSLFGSKKKTEESSTSVSSFATAGPAAAAALLGPTKSAKSLQASGSSSPTSPGFNSFARYPIHVERAVYRLSHIKLANARRPLIEQVLISNLMFWYLGVIGRNPTQNDEKKGLTNGLDKNRAAETANNPALKGTPPKPADTGSAGVKQDDDDPPPSPVRKSLNKPERSRGTNPEAAYREPAYGAQKAQMDKEVRNPSPGPRDAHSPPPPQPQQHQQAAPPQQQSRQPVMHREQSPPQPHQPQHYPPQVPQQARSSSVPGRTRSPPQQPPQQYPPGVAPPRAPPQSQYGPPMGGPGRSMSGDPRQRPMSLAGPQHHGGPLPQRQGAPYPQNGPRQGDARPMYPAPQGSPKTGSKKHNGPQPGQIFQYPGAGGGGGGPQGYPRPPGAGGPQPGQIFNGPGPAPQMYHNPQQYQGGPGGPGPQQRPGPQQGNWQPPQRSASASGGAQRIPPGATIVDVPPRRSSGHPDGYGHRPVSHYPRDGSTSPTQQHFYAAGNARPTSTQPNQYQYGQSSPGRQPVPSGQQYPHHR